MRLCKLELDNGYEPGLPLNRLILMQAIVTNMAALAVAMLFYLWRAHSQFHQRRRRILCQRVACLLLAVADRIKNGDSGVSAACRG